MTADNFVQFLQAGAAGVGFVRAHIDPKDLADGSFTAIERRAVRLIKRLDEA